MITADLMSRITLFAKVPENERASLAARAADLRLRKDEWLLVEGQTPGFYGLLEGHIDVLKVLGGREHRLTTYGPGDYFGEVPLLLGSPAIANLRATEPCRVLRLEGTDFLQLVSQCQVLSSEITKTMAARVSRISQIQVDNRAAVVTVIGDAHDPACYDLREFLARNSVAFVWREPDNGTASASADPSVAPAVVLLADGTRLETPTFRRLAEALGLQTEPTQDGYDVVIVGGGPAGLAAAVFGAELLVSRSVARVEPGDPETREIAAHTIVLEDDSRVEAKAVILASGVEWRRLSVPGIERLVGHGVYYGAARTEALRMQGRTVHLVGGGNSAGQAALLFAEYAASVTMLVRGRSLAASMSQYLVDQLSRQANVRVETDVEV